MQNVRSLLSSLPGSEVSFKTIAEMRQSQIRDLKLGKGKKNTGNTNEQQKLYIFNNLEIDTFKPLGNSYKYFKYIMTFFQIKS